MKISHIRISNILGLEELEFAPGGFTAIEGKNGTGKTSVLEAIKAVVKSGHDATLLRAGAEKGEIVFVLDDGMEITRRVTAADSKTEVRDADGTRLTRPAEAIRALTDALSVNPVEFLTAPKKDRVRVLLESMPIPVDADELSRISGIKVQVDPRQHGLAVIEQVAKQVYDERTGTNRAVKEKDATISQLRQALPEPVGGVEGSEDDIAAKLAAATTARDTTLGKIRTKLDGVKAKVAEDIGKIRERLQADIDALKAAAQQEVDAINADLLDNTTRAGAATEKAHATFAAAATPLNTTLTSIRANRDASARRTVTLQTIDTLVTEAEDLRQMSYAQTKALADIDAYKAGLLAALPIPGLEVREGEIYRDGVPFDRLNTAAQVGIAVELAKLRAGELGVVCLDRVECLDAEAFEALRDSMEESGLQCFVTKVGDQDFEINTSAQ